MINKKAILTALTIFSFLTTSTKITNAASIPSAPNADPDCVILFCAIAGFPAASTAGPICVEALWELIDRVLKFKPPIGTCDGFGGNRYTVDPDPILRRFYNKTAIYHITYRKDHSCISGSTFRGSVTTTYTDGTEDVVTFDSSLGGIPIDGKVVEYPYKPNTSDYSYNGYYFKIFDYEGKRVQLNYQSGRYGIYKNWLTVSKSYNRDYCND